MNTLIDAFLYCWTDNVTNKLYVGVHKGSEDDGYISSSKTFMEQYKNRPHDFTRQILAKGAYKDVLSLETVILKTVDARRNNDFYNLSNNDGLVYREVQTLESNAKRSKTMMGKNTGPRPDYVVKKMSATKIARGSSAGANNSQYGVQKSHEVCMKISETRISKGVAKGSNNPMFGKTRSDLKLYNESMKGSSWYNNGEKSRLYHSNQVPHGWVKGRLLK
jgi:hypothetical protein